MITFEDVKNNEEINAYIRAADKVMDAIGYTEHSFAHVTRAAEQAADILDTLGYSERTRELARIAGYMHDIGNSINRHDHAHSGAILAYDILRRREMDLEDVLTVTAAIGHHDEHTGTAVDEVSAALILADKTDVRRNRVQNPEQKNFDIHDRVNYAALSSQMSVDREKRVIHMELQLDDRYCSLVDYFEIFLERMLMCRRAAEMLDCRFKLTANGSKLL